MKSPKTTVLGILTIVAAALNFVVGYLNGHPVDMTTTIASVTAGIGLVTAADHKN